MIAVTKLHSLFKRIIDETQSFYFEDWEVDGYLNDAQRWLFKRLLNPDGSTRLNKHGVNAYYESSKKIPEYLHPMLREIVGGPTNTYINWATINALVSPKQVYTLSGIKLKFTGQSTYYPAKWKSHAMAVTQSHLAFFTANKCEPWFLIDDVGYRIDPEADVEYKATAILYPTEVDFSGSVNSDFPEVLDRIIAYKAVELAGISMRDNELVQNIQREIIQIGL